MATTDSVPGSLQYLAFRAASDADLLTLRDRIRSHGVNVIGPIDHDTCRSPCDPALPHMVFPEAAH